jgi:hypothetical protein
MKWLHQNVDELINYCRKDNNLEIYHLSVNHLGVSVFFFASWKAGSYNTEIFMWMLSFIEPDAM